MYSGFFPRELSGSLAGILAKDFRTHTHTQ